MSLQPSRILRTLAAGVAPLVLAVACGGSPVYAPPPDDARTTGRTTAGSPIGEKTIGEKAAVIAVRQVGVPYRYGGSSADGFDCSGLVNFAYARAGKTIPRTTGELWRALRPVSAEELRAGDVLFFNIEGKASHVGLYLGDRRFVHAPSSGREVTVTDLDSGFYRDAFIRGGRPR